MLTVLVIALLTSIAVASATDGTAPASAPAASSTSSENAHVAEALAPVVDGDLLHGAKVALQVAQVDDGEEVFAYNADVALVPASVNKVVTSAAALHALGSAWRFHTVVLRDGEIGSDGVLDGNLYVYGMGDPTLVVEDLWKLAREVQVAGITKIAGDVVFDDTYFDAERLLRGWNKPVDLANGPAYFAPLGALTVNFNTTCLVVSPGAEEGQPARVQLDTPAGDAVVIDNQVKTGSARSRRWVRIERAVDPKTGAVTFTLEGHIPVDDRAHRYYRAVGDPRTHFMGVFGQVLAERGISVEGRYRSGTVPKDAEKVAEHLSQPLCEVLNHMNKYSSNIMAEQVLKAMGAEVKGAPGTTDKGLEVVKSYLREIGVPDDAYTLVNGSGLSRDVRMTPTVVTAVLLDMYRDRRLGPEFLSSLSIAGVDGTLRRRFRDLDEDGLVRGKTGSMDGVYCLAGYIEARDGKLYAFALLANDLRRYRYGRAIEQSFAQAMFGLDGSPSTPTLAGATVDDDTGARPSSGGSDSQGAAP